MVLVYVPVYLLLYTFQDSVIRWFTRDDMIVEQTMLYLSGAMPGMFLVGFADLQKRWLVIMRITHVAVISNTLTIPIHYVFSYIAVYKLELGLFGLGWAYSASFIIVNIMLYVHTKFLPGIQEAVFLPNKDTFTGLKAYMSIAIKMIGILMAFVIAMELRMIFAGQLGDTELTATAALVNISYAFSALSSGLQMTTSSVIGNLLGENQPEFAWKLYKTNMRVWFFIFLSMWVFMNVFAEQICTLYSAESDAKYLEVKAMKWSATFTLLTCLKAAIQSPFISMKKHVVVLATQLTDYYLIGLPLSAALAFSGWGVDGLFMGGTTGTLCGFLFIAFFHSRIDYKLEAELCQKRLIEEQSQV
jgi:MATE family multidrug resistance protein